MKFWYPSVVAVFFLSACGAVDKNSTMSDADLGPENGPNELVVDQNLIAEKLSLLVKSEFDNTQIYNSKVDEANNFFRNKELVSFIDLQNISIKMDYDAESGVLKFDPGSSIVPVLTRQRWIVEGRDEFNSRTFWPIEEMLDKYSFTRYGAFIYSNNCDISAKISPNLARNIKSGKDYRLALYYKIDNFKDSVLNEVTTSSFPRGWESRPEEWNFAIPFIAAEIVRWEFVGSDKSSVASGSC
jgi:hypothetical protein